MPTENEKEIIGVIAPHAGIQFSGKGQAHSYKAVGEAPKADVYVILGTCHTGYPKAATLLEEFRTPLGIVSVDEEYGKRLIEKEVVADNHLVHDQEHSIEVQLPYLQFVKGEVKILPIVCGEETDYQKLGKEIVSTAKELGRKIILICSSDFTHYGINYAYMPFNKEIPENMKKLDMEAIKWIEKLDEWSLLDYVNETKATICGTYAIATFIIASKALGAKKAELLHYYTSGDITKDWSNAVGYASIKVNQEHTNH